MSTQVAHPTTSQTAQPTQWATSSPLPSLPSEVPASVQQWTTSTVEPATTTVQRQQWTTTTTGEPTTTVTRQEWSSEGVDASKVTVESRGVYTNSSTSNFGTQHLSNNDSSQGYERRVSSTILQEEYLEKPQEDSVRYVEVPEIVIQPKYVTKKSIVEVEKRVPKYEVSYVEKIVEVPQIQYVDKMVEVERIEEVIRHVPKKEVVTVNREVIKHVPKYETRTVEKIVEVPGEVIEVPKPYVVKNEVFVPQHIDRQVPVVIAQSLHPFLHDSPDEVVDLEVVEHAPQVFEVEVQVPKPVSARIWSTGAGKSYHKVVSDVPPAQFNTLLKLLNPHLRTDQEKETLPFMRDSDGVVQMLADNQRMPYVELPKDAKLVTDDGRTIQPGMQQMLQQASRGVADDGMMHAMGRGVSTEDQNAHMRTQSVTSSQQNHTEKKSKRSSNIRGDSAVMSQSGKYPMSQASTMRKATGNTSRISVPKKSRACAC